MKNSSKNCEVTKSVGLKNRLSPKRFNTHYANTIILHNFMNAFLKQKQTPHISIAELEILFFAMAPIEFYGIPPNIPTNLLFNINSITYENKQKRNKNHL